MSVFWRPAAFCRTPSIRGGALHKNAEVWRLWSRGKGTAKDHGKGHLFGLRSRANHQKVGSKRCHIFPFFNKMRALVI
jgi:hypothetical protein